MKVKEIQQLGNVSWSPAGVHPLYLACGTAAQQLDANLNTSSTLAVYHVDLATPSLEAKVAASIEVPGRFHAVRWAGRGAGQGMIMGGCDNNALVIYDAAKLLAGQDDCVLGSTEGQQNGPVYTISCNPFKDNLVATGSSECDILVWDISKLSSPMVPGKKANLGANVSCVEFNRQAEHILASTYAGHCVIWDLRKTASIISIVDSVSRIKASSISWNPDVATQLLLASDDDSCPSAQVWDLRYANAPLRTLEGHQRGILATAWCAQDSGLLLTASKDNKILGWNPNYGERGSEIVCEFPSYNQWSFGLDWCKRDPSLVAAASVDGSVSVYSITGGGVPPVQSDKFSAIADSFPGMEMPVVVPQGATPQPIQVKNPPKWFVKPAGANFSFGGRLVSWGRGSGAVTISQVVTEEQLVERSVQLETALSQPQLAPFCQAKAEAAAKPTDQVLWKFIGANFEESPHTRYLGLLGYSGTQVADKVRPAAVQDAADVTAEVLANKMENLATNDGSTGSLDPSEQFEMIAAQSYDKTPEIEEVEPVPEAKSSEIELNVEESGESSEGLITQALLVGDLESAVELCLKDRHYPHALTLAQYAGAELYAKTRDAVLGSVDGALAAVVSAVVRGDVASIVASCQLRNWKEALVAALTYCQGDQFAALAESLGERLEASGEAEYLPSAMICYICGGCLERFVVCWSKVQPNLSNPNDLQDLVEIIMVLQRSLTAAGKPVNLSEGSTVSALLCQYASLLAAQGALNTAVSYLNSATQGEMIELRDRLYRALGYQTGKSSQQVTVASQPAARRSSTPHYQPQPTQFTPSVQAQQRSIYGEPVQPAMQPPAPAPAPAPAMFNPAAQMPHHPVASQPPPTFGVPPLQPLQSMQPPMAAPPTGPPPTMGASPAGGLRRGGAGRYVSDTSMQTPSITQPAFMTPAPGAPPGPPNPSAPSAMPPTGPQFFTPATQAPVNAPMYGGDQGVPQPAALPAKAPAAYDNTVPRGWNDPPPITASRKAKQQPAVQPAEPPMVPMVPMVPSAPEPPQQFMGFPQYGEGAGPAVAAAAPPAVPANPEPASKGPLPPEHQPLEQTFNALRDRCLAQCQNQQVKQRLDDIGRKLEILYDKIRQGQLGQFTLGGLHQITASIKAGDYQGALQTHGQTVAKGNFSEMSQFMPAVKMLLQTCMQLQIFL